MKKLLLLAVVSLFALTLFACGNGDDDQVTPLVIYQNKVEIDDVLRAYANAWGEANGVDVEVVTCGGDSCGYADQLLSEFNRAVQPDIFVFEGLGQFLEYQNFMMPLTGEDWVADTDVPFMYEGEVYGFPINFEGWGMGYNKDILDAAGVDPATLTSREAYAAAFATIQAKIDDGSLPGVTTVVSMVQASGMYWTTGLHNFNGYLSSGLDYDDRTVIDDLLEGRAHRDRVEALADWVELLFNYTESGLLMDGQYDQQVNAFKLGRAAFIHQGNWIDPNLLADGGIDFEVGYAPHASGLGTVDSIFVGAPSYYAINPNGKNTELAKQFLNDLALTEEGHEYMVVDANMVPAFNSVELVPTAPLSAAVFEWAQDGNIYAWWQNDMPPGFGMDTLGPVYSRFATGDLTKAQFINEIIAEIEELGN